MIGTTTRKSLRDRVLYAHEFLFSFNVALVAVIPLRWSRSGHVLDLLLRLKLRVNSLLGLHPHHDVGIYVATLALALAVAALMFLLLRLFSETSFTQEMLRSMSIVVALAVPFKCWVDPVWPYGHELLEVGVFAILAVVISLRPSLLPAWLVAFLLVLHFGFWFWLYWRDTFPYYFMLLVPMAPFGSGVAWFLYTYQTVGWLTWRSTDRRSDH